MRSHVVHTLNFESRPLHLGADPSQRTGGIRPRENVLPHEETPDEIFITPCATESGHLKVEHPIVLQHAVDHFQEFLVTANTNVFRHFEAGDSVVSLLGKIGALLELHGVLEKDSCTVLLIEFFAPGQLFFREGDSRDVRAVLLGEAIGHIGPAASYVQDGHARFKFDGVRDVIDLVILRLLKSFITVRIEAGGVHHGLS
mmetsp:Transcript_11587/g.20869  ORF Transcript_11587/g.20869 Transcript_11587/m.20869 type:complete len:200 (-) Transcript_11587:698-1297(-)